jgi:hypothetical protein
MDNHFMERPNAKRVQLDFFYDYGPTLSFIPNGKRS